MTPPPEVPSPSGRPDSTPSGRPDPIPSGRPDSTPDPTLGPGRGASDPGSGPPRLPVVTLVLMGVFLVGGSLGLVVDWPPGPAHLDWGVWLLVYGGYAYVIAATLFHVKTGR